jgi:hypothetical protein
MSWEKSVASDYLDLLDRVRRHLIAEKDGTWTADTAYALEFVVEPVTPNGYRYECTTAGTSDSSAGEPTWPTTIGDTVADGTATWTCISTKISDTDFIWTVEKQTYALPSTDGEIYFNAPGNDNDKNIYLNIKTYSDVGDGHYAWELLWATDFDGGLTIYNQPGALSVTNSPKFNLSTTSMQYWIVANGNRVMIFTFLNTYYFSAHLGFFNSYIPPSNYPLPIMVAGSYHQYKQASDIINTSIFIPYNTSSAGDGSGWIRNIDGSPHPLSPDKNGNLNCFFINPYGFQDTQTFYYPTTTNSNYVVLPAMLVYQAGAVSGDYEYIMGEFDGLYWVTGNGLVAGDTITVGSDTYLIIQDLDNAAAMAAVRLI